MISPIEINVFGSFTYNDAPYRVFSTNGLLISGHGNDGVLFIDPGFDTDEDGIPDAFEKSFGLNYLDLSDAIEDPDNDNLNNLEEMQAGSGECSRCDGTGELVDILQNYTCARCNGSGTCPTCNGSGVVYTDY